MGKQVVVRSMLCALVVAGCSEDEPEELVIDVDALVGGQPFSCSASFAGLGRGGSTFTPTDFRMYVHDVEVITEDGARVRAPFVADNSWQQESVALLDFEDASGSCANGTPEVNTRLVVSVPADTTFTGIALKIGVPQELNHQNQATALSPLNITGMHWSWTAGYKFLKLDGSSDTMDTALFHLGSTMCTGDAPDITCMAANRPSFEVDGWRAGDALTLDVAALFDGAHLDTNEGGPAGCMSGPEDADCAPLFSNLGLSHSGVPGAQRAIFSAK
ncbi:MAG: MbnP family copper-binding protein [Myxococcota bacterium]